MTKRTEAMALRAIVDDLKKSARALQDVKERAYVDGRECTALLYEDLLDALEGVTNTLTLQAKELGRGADREAELAQEVSELRAGLERLGGGLGKLKGDLS